MDKYFYTDGREKFGPFAKEELKNEPIDRNTKIWYHGLEQWTKISEIKELEEIVSSIPPQLEPIEKVFKQEEEIIKDNYIKKESSHTKSKTKIVLISAFTILFIIFLFYNLAQEKNESDRTPKNIRLDLYSDIVSNSYDFNLDFQMYVDKFYRDLDVYGIYPKKPQKTIIKFSQLDQMESLTHVHAISYGINNDNLIEIYHCCPIKI